MKQTKQRDAGIITREYKPLNVEFPFSSLDSFLTPNERFYVRNHFDIPKTEEKEWRLKIEGAVETSLEISYAQLLSMPAKTIAVTLECAGNSRIFLEPKAGGVQWELGAVGTAEWTGVPLKMLLEKAGVKIGAVEVVLVGADRGEIQTPPKTPGEIAFSHSLPLEKALTDDVLLAYEMNGERLAPEHGFPVRAVVPGWYGMAWVKWIERIILVEEPFTGYFQTADYSYWVKADGMPARMVPVTEMQVKSQISSPAMRERVAADSRYKITGAAWSGDARISKVEVSIDGGETWAEAQLKSEERENVWQMWEYDWQTPVKTGKYTVMSRATDERGRVQPSRHAEERGGYLVNHTLPVEIEVK